MKKLRPLTPTTKSALLRTNEHTVLPSALLGFRLRTLIIAIDVYESSVALGNKNKERY